MSDATVDLDIDENGVALVTLNAPERRNSMDLAMVGEIVAIMDRSRSTTESAPLSSPARAKGSARVRRSTTSLDRQELPRAARLVSVYDGFLVFANCSKPTIAAVNGAAVGAGMNLALACDLRIASTRAKFITRFLDLGLHPGGGHTWMMQRAVGPQVARAMVLFGQEYSGEDAVHVGLAYECTEPDALIARALEIGARAASMPRELSQRTKATMNGMWTVESSPEAVAIELEVQAWSLQQPDFKERMAALQKKS